MQRETESYSQDSWTDTTVLGDWTLEDRASLQGTVVQLPWGLPRACYLSHLSLVPCCCVTPRLPPLKNLLYLRLHQDVLAEPTGTFARALDLETQISEAQV